MAEVSLLLHSRPRACFRVSELVSEALATVVVAAVGVMFLCLASVVLALKVKGDRSISWSGFGVVFRVSPCRDCPADSELNITKGDKS